MATIKFLVSQLERFSIPEPNSGCWLWIGGCHERGYGQLRVGHTCVRASRLAYSLWKGYVPDGELVCHSCDTPSCINPDHLFLGTHSSNAIDAAKKGRGGNQYGYGFGPAIKRVPQYRDGRRNNGKKIDWTDLLKINEGGSV